MSAYFLQNMSISAALHPACDENWLSGTCAALLAVHPVDLHVSLLLCPVMHGQQL
jgi:hypothetical protein